jgi:AcrR family transcriptional regulator
MGVDRRTQLVDVALELFDEQGVRGASMRELARRVGVNVAATYHHFESKRALLQAVFDERFDDVRWLEPEAVEAALVELRGVDRQTALATVIEGTLLRLEENAAFVRLVHVEVLYGDEDARAVGHEMWSRWLRILTGFVEGIGIASGTDADAVGRLLRAVIWGTFHELQLTQERDSAALRRRAQGLAKTLLATGIDGARNA